MNRIFLACYLVSAHLCTLNAQTDRHVILVIIDGARYSETLGDSLGRYIPRMRELSRQGVVVDSMLNDSITVTMRAIPAIWCGSWSIPKDTTVNGFANQYATVPTMWEYFRKSRSVDSTHALYIMKWLNTPWIQSFYPQYGPAYWPWYILQGTTDLDVWQNAKSKLQTYHSELAVIYLPDVDSSPARGWSAYTQALVTADSIVGMLWDFLQSDPIYQNKTTLLVTNDHGRHLDGIQNGFVSHGDGCWGCRHIMFLGVGAGMPKGIHTSLRRTIPDIAPTIGSLLQFSTPYATGRSMIEILTSVETESHPEPLPKMIHLEQNYPNPFNPKTTIRFSIPQSGLVSLKIYNLLGDEVATLVSQDLRAGAYTSTWDARTMSSGLYLCRIQSGTSVQTMKLVLLK
jgi:hypothetical protein